MTMNGALIALTCRRGQAVCDSGKRRKRLDVSGGCGENEETQFVGFR